MENLNSINIHGKSYIPVNERIKYFRNQKQYEGWTIETEIVSMTDTSVVMKTFIKDTTGRVVATGYSAEDRNASQINATSMIENAETSAVGRALGMLGIGIDTSVASADEVNNAVRRQENTNVQQPQNNTNTNYQPEFRDFQMEDGNVVRYKKAYSKRNNGYFWLIVDESLANTYPKFLKYEG
jgi:hypothetical protein